MINNIPSTFSIKELENLSGIKAHTIRIWEKRYNLLSPKRNVNNIRSYDTKALLKLFNTNYLLRKGYKLSKLALISDSEISQLVLELSIEKGNRQYAIDKFIFSMMNFDVKMFQDIYNNLLNELTFKEILYEIFFPLLIQLGLLWQSNTITPAHEHFISNLIKQKLLIHLDKLSTNTNTTHPKYVLFLPLKEMHEIGLLSIYYELRLLGKYVIYLGECIPTDSLVKLSSENDKIIFISYFTVYPTNDNLENYIDDFSRKILDNTLHELWITGRNVASISHDKITVFDTSKNMLNKIT